MNAARIEEVVSDYVTLRKRGVNLLGLCPFHDEKTGSFTVSPAKGIFKCFGCGKGGNSVHFIMEHEHVSYVEALKMLAKKYNIEVQERELSDREREVFNTRESMFLVNAFAQKHFSETLHNDPMGRSVGLAYFRERGFREDIIKKFQLGFSLEGWDNFAQKAKKAGYKDEYLTKTGLCFSNDKGGLTDRFRGRVMFPIHTLSGKVIAFGGRILKKDDKAAKYVNSPESEIYHKSNELYGIYLAKQAIVKHDRCFLVEGYTDVISMHQSGIENVVASSGTALTPGQIRLIHRFTENITIIYDGDAAGIKASLRGIELLLEEGMNIKVVLLPNGEDPDSFARSRNASDFVQYVEEHQTDFVRFIINTFSDEATKDPIKRKALIENIVSSIAMIPNQIMRQVYVRDCSELLEMDEKVLLNAIAKINNEKRSKVILKKKQDEQKAAMNVPPIGPDETMEDAANNISPIEISSSHKFDAEARNLIQLLIRHGEKPLFMSEDGVTPVTVGQYVLEELERDQIVFENQVYRTIIGEYKQNQNNAGFVAENFFKFHPDSKLSQLAIDLMTDKYVISRMHQAQNTTKRTENNDPDNLLKIVPQLIFELKNSLVTDMMKKVLSDIKQACVKKDETLLREAMTRKEQLDYVRRTLSQTLHINPVVKF